MAEKGTSSFDEYLKSLEANGTKIDEPTRMGMLSAVGSVASEYHNKEIASQKAGQEFKPSKAELEKMVHNAVANEDLFLEKAGTRAVVDKYADDLIKRSYEKDKAQGVEEGTNLRAFMHETGNTVNRDGRANYQEIHDAVKNDNKMYLLMHQNDLKQIENEVSQSANNHVTHLTEQSVQKDYVQVLEDHKEDPEYKKLKVNRPDPSLVQENNPLMQIIQLLAKLLGGGDVFASSKSSMISGGTHVEDTNVAMVPNMGGGRQL